MAVPPTRSPSIPLFVAFSLVLALSAPCRADDLDDKWKSLKQGAWEPWFELADASLKAGTDVGRHRARVIWEALARLHGTPHGSRARQRLAALYAGTSAKARFLRSAQLLLAGLAETGKAPEAEKALQALTDEHAKRKEKLVTVARTALDRRDYDHAREVCCQAQVLPGAPDKPAPFLEILAAIQARKNLKAKEAFASLQPTCGACNGKGCVDCPKCKPRQGGGWAPRPMCSVCGGTGIVPCKPCLSTGYNLEIFTVRERKALYALTKLIQPQTRTGRLGDAFRKTAEGALGYACAFPDRISLRRREALQLIPVQGRKPPRSVDSLWKTSDFWVRKAILLDVAVRAVRYCGTGPLFVPKSRKGRKGDSCGLQKTPVVPPALVAAFPERFDRHWVTLKGKVDRVEESAQFRNMRRLFFQDLDSDAMLIVAWDDKGGDVHKFMRTYGRKAYWLADYPARYRAAEVGRALNALLRGNTVALTGRLYFKQMAWPRTVFEVWRVQYRDTKAPDASGKDKPAPGDPANPCNYLRIHGSQGKAKTYSRWKRERLLDTGLGCLASAEELNVQAVADLDIKTAWQIIEVLEEAREYFRIMKVKEPGDALSDELFLRTTRLLLRAYERAGKKG